MKRFTVRATFKHSGYTVSVLNHQATRKSPQVMLRVFLYLSLDNILVFVD